MRTEGEFQHPPPWPVYGDDAIGVAQDLLRRGRAYDYGRGPEIAALEDAFAAAHSRRYALAVNSGTSALFLAYLALGVAAGQSVVVPTFTFMATATPLFLLRATPVLADSGEPSGNVTAASIEAVLRPCTEGVAVTHLYGIPCPMDEIAALARARGLFLVEDCSHAHGSVDESGRGVGTWGDVAVFSISARKMVSGGMGGVLLTDRDDVYDIACLASASQQRSVLTVKDPARRALADTGLGGNLRITPIAAALARSHFDDLEALKQDKERNVDLLIDELCQLPGLARIPVRAGIDAGARYGVHLRFVRDEVGAAREVVLHELRSRGLKVGGPQATPLHAKSIFCGDVTARAVERYTGELHVAADDFPVSSALADEWVSLPADYLYGDASALVEQYVTVFHRVWESLSR